MINLIDFVGKTCPAPWNVLEDTYMPTPTEETWMQCERFKQVSLWNFPNCVGAIDGKHDCTQAWPTLF